jgi:putative peptidoglycan lipid II flippase
MALLRDFATVGGATASSRVLGFIRDMFIAAALGSGPVAEAFFVAQRLPNLFRRLFAEGAFQSAFVPIFTRTLERDGKDEARRFAEESQAALAAALLLFTLLAEIFMVWLTLGLAPGFAADPSKFDLTVLLSRIAFPYLALVSLVSLLAGALNGMGRFAAAAFSPALLNIVLIGALVFVFLTGQVETVEAGLVLAAAIVIGGVVQFAFLAYACHRAGLTLKIRMPKLTPGVRHLARLGAPSVLAGGVVQINIVVGTIIASLQPGAVSWLYYADRLYQLPLGIVGIAIATVLLPEIARAIQGSRDDIASHTQNRGIEFAAAITLPAAVALFVIPAPILAVLFERGAFTTADTAATAPALAAYAVGLPAFVAIRVLQPGFFAREDTKTPMYYGAVSMVVNVVAALVLFQFFAHVGIAAATTIAAWVNTGMLLLTLRRRGHFMADAALKRSLPLLAAASAAMGVGLFFAAWALGPYVQDQNILVRVAVIAALVILGLALFLVFCHITGAVDFRRHIATLRNRRQVPPPVL